MATTYTFTIDGHTFERDEVPARGPIVESSPQNWSQQDVLGAGGVGSVLTFLGYKSQTLKYTSHADEATKDKLVAIYEAREEVTFTTPQNTTGFKVVMTELSVQHEEPIENGKYLCRFTLVSRAPVSSDVPAEQEDEDMPTIVIKQVDQTIQSETDISANPDDELLLAVGANEAWIIQLGILYTTGATPDFKWGFDIPAGANVGRININIDDVSTVTEIDGGTLKPTGITAEGDGSVRGLVIWAPLQVAGTSGNFVFQWSQFISDASDTTVEAESFLIAWKQ